MFRLFNTTLFRQNLIDIRDRFEELLLYFNK